MSIRIIETYATENDGLLARAVGVVSNFQFHLSFDSEKEATECAEMLEELMKERA